MATGIGSVNTFTAPPDWQAQQADIERRRAMAQAMQEQGMQPDGATQSINGVAIPNSWTQGLAKALKVGLGGWQQKQLTDEQKRLYRDQQDTYAQAGSDLMRQVTPRAATAAQPGMIDEVGGINAPEQGAQPAYSPDQGDHGKAYMSYLTKTGRNDLAAPFALQNAQRQIMMSQMLRPDSPASTALADGAAQGSVGPTNENAAAMTANVAAGPTMGGIPQALAARLMAADQTGKLLAESQAGLFKQQQAPINVRQGGTVYMPGRGPIFSAPQNGIQTNYGPNGPNAAPVPGYIPAMQGITGAQEAAKLPYETVPVMQASGATVQLPKAQIPGIGQPPGAMPPAGAPMPAPPSGAMPNSALPTDASGALTGIPDNEVQKAQAAGVTVKSDPWATMPKMAQPQGMGQSTFQRSIAEGAGKAASDLSKKYGDAANTANQRMATNNQALEMVDRADTGPLAAKIGDVKNWLTSRFGVPESDFENTPSATQALQKDLVNAATQRAKQQFGSRITQSEVMLMLTRGAPNVDMTKAAIKYLVGTDNAQAQYSIKQANDLGEYLNRGGDPMRFEGWYSQAFPQTNAVAQVKLNTGTPSPQDIADEMRKRGLIK